jgi:single-strand DNA-binding protein
LNRVLLKGKVSRVGKLKYTPSGIASLRFTLAVAQQLLDKESVGYIETLLFDKLAETGAQGLKIGKTISLDGHLWVRVFRNPQGIKMSETRVIVSNFELD